jgi:hypothetical protein
VTAVRIASSGRWRLILALVALRSAGAQSPTEGRALRGRVIDAVSGLPLSGVVVFLTAASDTVSRAQTDSAGVFVLIGIRPSATVHFRRLGYRADSLAADANAHDAPLRVAMAPLGAQAAQSLEPTRVSATSARTPFGGFEERARRNNGGVFITAEQMKKAQAHTSDVFRQLRGVTLVDSAGIMQIVSQRGFRPTLNAGTGRGAPPRPGASGATPPNINSDGARMVGGAGKTCALRVALDGRLMDASFSVNEVAPSAIRGIEVYVGVANIPVEFSSVRDSAPCGLVMIWTRY